MTIQRIKLYKLTHLIRSDNPSYYLRCEPRHRYPSFQIFILNQNILIYEVTWVETKDISVFSMTLLLSTDKFPDGLQ